MDIACARGLLSGAKTNTI